MDKLGLGRDMERLVMKRWNWNGFTCWQPPRSKWSGQDLFGLFDFIAVKPFCPVNLVQVKRSRRKEAEEALDDIKSFAEHYHCPIAPFVVLWAKERDHFLSHDDKVVKTIRFKSWQYGLTGWFNAGEWSEMS